MFNMIPLFIVSTVISVAASSQVQVVAHRGANKEAPENTYAAAERCIEMGVSYVEIDVRMSADSVFFILHDATVNRTTDGRGHLSGMAAAEVRKLDAGSWFDQAYAEERIPELVPFLQAMKGSIGVYLDVKDGDIQRLVQILRSLEMAEDIFLWSGSKSTMETLSRTAPEFRLKCNASSVPGIRRAVRRYAPSIIEIRPAQYSDRIQRFCAENNLQLMLYTNRTDEATFMELLRYGPDLVNIDDPRRFIALREKLR